MTHQPISSATLQIIYEQQRLYEKMVQQRIYEQVQETQQRIYYGMELEPSEQKAQELEQKAQELEQKAQETAFGAFLDTHTFTAPDTHKFDTIEKLRRAMRTYWAAWYESTKHTEISPLENQDVMTILNAEREERLRDGPVSWPDAEREERLRAAALRWPDTDIAFLFALIDDQRKLLESRSFKALDAPTPPMDVDNGDTFIWTYDDTLPGKGANPVVTTPPPIDVDAWLAARRHCSPDWTSQTRRQDLQYIPPF